jgi:heat shock protein HtpX
MFKRFSLFFLVNILIMITISIMLSIVTSIFGVNRYLTQNGINYLYLFIFCLIWGMGGSLISLFLSKFIAKMTMGVKVVDPSNPGEYSFLVRRIDEMSRSANIPMPEVGIYDSPEMNAFATGATKNKSLVAVSTGLLNSMNNEELEGVLAHEITHISNGDMVTMTLIAGVVNSFAMFISRILSFFISKMVDEKLEGIVRWVLTMIFDIFLSILGSIAVNYFSRRREFRADAGGAKLAGRQNMIAALQCLQRKFEPVDERGGSLATMKISGKKGFSALFSTHPDLETRIEALRNAII